MNKKISKTLLATFLIVVMLFSVFKCFAEEVTEESADLVTAQTSDTQDSSTEEETEKNKIHEGDLYLFDTDVVMDQLVDGNVFIFGNNVKITGQINGNLFVCANNVTFGLTPEEIENGAESQCYVRYSAFVCAPSVYYNGACNDLYVAAQNLEMTYDAYVVRDVKAICNTTTFLSAIGRDVDLECSKVNFVGEEEDKVPIIYGNLRYSADQEATIPEGVLANNGQATYNGPINNESSSTEKISDILINILTSIITVIALYFVFKYLTPKFNDKISKNDLKPLSLLKNFGIGLASFVLVFLIVLLLLMSHIGVKLAFIVLVVFILLLLISVPVLAIAITNTLKPVLKIENLPLFLLILALVKVVLYGLTILPSVGFVFTLIIVPTAIGSTISTLLSKEDKDLKVNEE